MIKRNYGINDTVKQIVNLSLKQITAFLKVVILASSYYIWLCQIKVK